LRPLEDKRLVLLAPEARHRARMLELTAAGRSTLTKALPLWEVAQRTIKRRLGTERWPAVQDALAELTEETRLQSS
jgi:DNA-binding MarR family transcriptional regulator